MNKTKQIKIIFMVLALNLLIPCTARANQNQQFCIQREQVEYRVKTKGCNVNLRKGASTKNGIITRIPNGSKIVKISDYKNGKWAKTVYTNDKGKEYIGYILYDDEYIKEECEMDSRFGMITHNRVIFRASGTRTSAKYGYFYKGYTVEIIENANKNGYIKIRVVNTDGKYPYAIGYVHKDYVKI